MSKHPWPPVSTDGFVVGPNYVWSTRPSHWAEQQAVGLTICPCADYRDATRTQRHYSHSWSRGTDRCYCPGVVHRSVIDLSVIDFAPIPNPFYQPSSKENTMTAENTLEVIAEELRREATKRSWCDEYDQFVDRVNTRVGRPVLQPLTPKPRRVTITVPVTIEVEIANGTAPDVDTAGTIIDGLLSRVYTHVGNGAGRLSPGRRLVNLRWSGSAARRLEDNERIYIQ